MMGAALLGGGGGGGGGGGFSVAIGSGARASGTSSSHTFGANTAVHTGGTPPYTDVWSHYSLDGGNWSDGTGPTFAPTITGVTAGGNMSEAGYICNSTDSSVPPLKAVSNLANYGWTNTTGGYY